MAEKKLPKINRQWRTWSLKSFHGGLNTKDSNTTLNDFELRDATGINVNSFGKITLSGRWKELDDYPIPEEFIGLVPQGAGLHYFKGDYRLLTYRDDTSTYTIEDIDAIYEKEGVHVILIQSGRFFHIRQQIGSEIAYLYNAISILGDSDIGEDLPSIPFFNSYYVDKALRVSDGNFLNEATAEPLSKALIFYNNEYFGEDSVVESQTTSMNRMAPGTGTGNNIENAFPTISIYSDRIFKPYLNHIPIPNNYMHGTESTAIMEYGGSIIDSIEYTSNPYTCTDPDGGESEYFGEPGKPGVSCHLPVEDSYAGGNNKLAHWFQNPWTGFLPRSTYVEVHQGNAYLISRVNGWVCLDGDNGIPPTGGAAFGTDHNFLHFHDWNVDITEDSDFKTSAHTGGRLPHIEFFQSRHLELDNPDLMYDFTGDPDGSEQNLGYSAYSKYWYNPNEDNWLAINDWAPYKEAYQNALAGNRNYSSPIRAVFFDPETTSLNGNYGRGFYPSGSTWTPLWLITPFKPSDTPLYGNIAVYFDILGIHDPKGPYWDAAGDFPANGMLGNMGLKFVMTKLSKDDNFDLECKATGSGGLNLNNSLAGDLGFMPPEWESSKRLDTILQSKVTGFPNSNSYGDFPLRNCHWGTIHNAGAFDALGLGLNGGSFGALSAHPMFGTIDMANFRFEYIPFGTGVPSFPLDFNLTITRVLDAHNPSQDFNQAVDNILILNPHEVYWEFPVPTEWAMTGGSSFIWLYIYSFGIEVLSNHFYRNNRNSPTFLKWDMSTDSKITKLNLSYHDEYTGIPHGPTDSEILYSASLYKRRGMAIWNGINNIAADGMEKDSDLTEVLQYNEDGYPEMSLSLGGAFNEGVLMDPFKNSLNFLTEQTHISEDEISDIQEELGSTDLNLDFTASILPLETDNIGEIDVAFAHDWRELTEVFRLSSKANILQTLYGMGVDDGIDQPGDDSFISVPDSSITWTGWTGDPISMNSWPTRDYIALDVLVPNDTVLYINTTDDSSNVTNIEGIKIVARIFNYPGSQPGDIEYDLPSIVNLIPTATASFNDIDYELTGNDQLAFARDDSSWQFDGVNPVIGNTLEEGYDYVSDFTGYIYYCHRLDTGSTVTETIGKSCHCSLVETYFHETAGWNISGPNTRPIFESNYSADLYIKINIENSEKYSLAGLTTLSTGQEITSSWPYQGSFNFILTALEKAATWSGDHIGYRKKIKKYGKALLFEMISKSYFPSSGDYLLDKLDHFRTLYGESAYQGDSFPICLGKTNYLDFNDLNKYDGHHGFHVSQFSENNTWVRLPWQIEHIPYTTPILVPILQSNDYDSGTTLSEDLDTTETGVDVGDGTKFEVGKIISIDGEIMEITNISSNTLTVIRSAVDPKTGMRPFPNTHTTGAVITIVPRRGYRVCGIVSPRFDLEQTKTNYENDSVPGYQDMPLFLEGDDFKNWFRSEFVEPYPGVEGIFVSYWGSI